MRKVLLVDGSALLYRSFYGVRPLFNSAGIATHAIFGFLNSLKKILKNIDAEKIVVAWDSPVSLRKKAYQDYKASRQSAPSELVEQKGYLVQILDKINLLQLEFEGFEADDILASLAQYWQKQDDFLVVVATADKDLLQLISEKIVVYDPFREKLFDLQTAAEYLGFPVSGIKMFYSLVGDSSDDIPGVAGIGKVSASKLVLQFDSLQNLYDNLDQVTSEKTKKLLIDGKENAFLSQELFSLMQVDLSNVQVLSSEKKDLSWSFANPIFNQLELKSFIVKEAISSEPVVLSKNFLLILDESALQSFCDQAERYDFLAVDVETSGLSWNNEHLVGISLAFDHQETSACYIPLAHVDSAGNLLSQQLQKEKVFFYLNRLFLNEKITKIFHNAKFDLHFFLKENVRLNGVIFDTALLARLIYPEWIRVGLKSLSFTELNVARSDLSDILKTAKGSFQNLSLDVAVNYAALDAHQTYLLFQKFSKNLQSDELLRKQFFELELVLLQVLLEMEDRGILLDLQKLAFYEQKINEQINLVLQKINGFLISQEIDPSQYNLNSPKQVHQLLFEKLKISDKKFDSVDVEVLSELAFIHPLPNLILQQRKLKKLKSTYIDGLRDSFDQETSAIHTNYSQIMVATGRLSSMEPNLQNIPLQAGEINIRDCFIARKGFVLVSIDYSQIELRLLAHISQDDVLTNAFWKKQDIHAMTAATIFEKEISNVSSAERDNAKRINFSILYGLSAFSLSKEFNISPKEAKSYIDAFFATYPKVLPWMEQLILSARENGYVQTLLGRKRWFKNLNDRNKNVAKADERAAINSVMQGSAADLIKLAMIKLHKFLQENNVGFLLLQIHDEVLLELAENVTNDVLIQIKQLMTSVVELRVPLDVTIKKGLSWGSLQKVLF